MQNLASGDPPSYSRAVFEQQVVTTLAAINLSFSAVKNLQFCQMLRMLQPDAEILSKKRVKIVLKERYSQIVAKSFQDLGLVTKVSLALDCWTSPSHLSFMAITAHYISKDWHFCEILIAFEHVPESYTGRNLAILVDCALQQYRHSKRLYAITTDNVSNNDTLRSQLAEILASRSIN